MVVPGLALFYGGLVRTKNMASVLMQVFAITCLMSIIWVVYGYSLAFTGGGSLNDWVGGLDKAFLKGVTAVLLLHDFVTLNKSPEARWADITGRAKRILAKA